MWLPASGQNRASWFVLLSVIQKFTPSLHAPNGMVTLPVEKTPIGVRSADFHSDTLLPKKFVTRIRWPSKAAWVGLFSPLPESVATTAPVAARTTDRVLSLLLEIGRAHV